MAIDQQPEIRKEFGKYYLALVALAATFLITVILAAYFVNNQQLGFFGIFYIVLLIFGLFLWTGHLLKENNALTVFILSAVGLFAISIVFGAISKQFSFMVFTTTPAWAQTTSPPLFLGIPANQLLIVSMNVPGPVSEESFFRVFLWRTASPALGKKNMLVGQALIFGVIHYFAFGGNFLQMAIAIAAGIYQGLLYWHYESELGIASGHLAYNMIALLLSAITGMCLVRF